MRILRVSPWLYPDTKGGGQYHVHALSRDQAARGHDVTVLTFRRNPSLSPTEEIDGYSVRRCEINASPLNNPMSLEMAHYLHKSEDFDVIHAHSQNYVSTNMAAIKRRLGDTPLAITNHGLYSQSAPKAVFGLYLRTLGRWTFNRADAIFCYTGAHRRDVQSLGVRAPIEVISNGVDAQRFTPSGPANDGMNGFDTTLLFVGRLVPGKRPRLLLETFTSYLDIDPTAELYLCGEGPLRDELQRLATDRGISDKLQFLGHVPYEEMPTIYRSADVLVLPSRAEGIPRTVLEASASGVPVVASNLSGMDAVVGSPGATVAFQEQEQAAEAIHRAVTSDESVEWDRDEYAWEKTVEETTAALESISGW